MNWLSRRRTSQARVPPLSPSGVWRYHPIGIVIGLGGMIWGISRSVGAVTVESITQAVLGAVLFVGSAYFWWVGRP